MIVYYENMNGEKLNLLEAPFRTTKTDWFDADWSESSDGYEKTVTILFMLHPCIIWENAFC